MRTEHKLSPGAQEIYDKHKILLTYLIKKKSMSITKMAQVGGIDGYHHDIAAVVRKIKNENDLSHARPKGTAEIILEMLIERPFITTPDVRDALGMPSNQHFRTAMNSAKRKYRELEERGTV